MDDKPTGLTNRRRFLQYLAMLGVAGRTLLRAETSEAAGEATTPAPETWPELPRRTLGRTGFEASRLVFGCGAALSKQPNDALLQTAFDAGINVFDVGSRSFYADAEKNLAPFLKTVRDKVFLISKAKVGIDVAPDDAISKRQAETAAATWLLRLETSLKELQVDHVDAYYLMGSHNPAVVASEEMLAAFDKAKTAGKVRHLGLSTHQNAENVLEAAMKTGQYSLAMVAVTPGGWYDWASRGVLEGSKTMTELQPFFERLRTSGIGLVGMKAGRALAGRRLFGWSNHDAFDAHYDERGMESGFSAFQRSYAFVLEHGLDVVNADMQSLPHLHENVVAAATSAKHFG